jgi:hypothetical protein
MNCDGWGRLRWVGELAEDCEKQIPLGDDNQKGKDEGAALGRAEVEVEKRISPLRGSQMREPLRSK